MKENTVSIILAGGEGTRIKSKEVNKVCLDFLGKPLIKYGVDILFPLCRQLVIVVGAFAESVKTVLKDYPEIDYTYQKERLGTGHATQIGMNIIKGNPKFVLVGYGDHLMFYRKETIEKLIEKHEKEKALVSLIIAQHGNPNELAWGRILRDKKGNITGIIEQKDASEKEKKIKDLNSGFYCFDYNFLKENIDKIEKSEVSGEYYITEMVKIAISQGKKVTGLKVPFEEVGIGINTREQLKESKLVYQNR